MGSRASVVGAAVGLVILSVIAYAVVGPGRDQGGDRVIATDTVIDGDLTIAPGVTTVLKGDAKLTVRGTLDVSGTLRCENGALFVEVAGPLNVNGSLACELGERASPGSGIAIVAGGNVTFAPDATVRTDGSVQIVDRAERIARTAADLEAIFDDIGRDTGDGVRLGPFVADDGRSRARSGLASIRRDASPAKPAAATTDSISVGGTWDLRFAIPFARMLAGDRRIVLIDAQARRVDLGHLTIDLPSGSTGEIDAGPECDRRGGPGGEAGRLLIRAVDTVRVYASATITFGAGGAGGSALTPESCYPTARARGGAGAESGNLKIVGGQAIVVESRLLLVPGAGGAGGEATAIAARGPSAGDPGGTATAVGGRGGDNRKVLRALGDVSGLAQVEIGPVIGGSGGAAMASAGNGADGSGCRAAGGDGGDATATGGAGGDASLRANGALTLLLPEAGRGGDVNATAGSAGEGGDCGTQAAGGVGGDGGEARATAGAPGSAGTAPAAATRVQMDGGVGGFGGDGCPAGRGGEGGDGFPRGRPGSPGRTVCPPSGDAAASASPSASPTLAAAPPAAPPQAPAPGVFVIPPPKYADLFALVDKLAGPGGASAKAEQAFLDQIAADIPRLPGRFTQHSSDAVEPRRPQPGEAIDAALALLTEVAARDAALNDVRDALSCGARDGHLVVCPATPTLLVPGSFWSFAIVTGAPISQSDPKYLYTFSVVLDTDGSPQNDLKPDPAFPNDFYKGTDRWYELSYAPRSGWRFDITVNAATGEQRTQSGARVLVKGNVLLFLIPKDELPAGATYRVTTFRHTGDFGMAPPHDWSGDLSPTVREPLRAIAHAGVRLP